MNKVIDYIKGVRQEIEKVEFPKRSEVIRLTLVVFSISGIVAGYVGGMDFALTKLLALFISI